MANIGKEFILLCEVQEFSKYDKKIGVLTEKVLEPGKQFRRVIVSDGYVIDFETGQFIETLERDENNLVVGEVRLNTMYAKRFYRISNHISDEEYEYAQLLYEDFLKRKKLIDEGKLLLFKQKRLF